MFGISEFCLKIMVPFFIPGIANLLVKTHVSTPHNPLFIGLYVFSSTNASELLREPIRLKTKYIFGGVVM